MQREMLLMAPSVIRCAAKSLVAIGCTADIAGFRRELAQSLMTQSRHSSVDLIRCFIQAPGGGMRRRLAVSLAGFLAACTSPVSPEDGQDSANRRLREMQQMMEATAERTEGPRCVKSSELAIGMDLQQVIATCGQRPRTAADSTTAQGKCEAWIYRDTTLLFVDGKLAEITRVR